MPTAGYSGTPLVKKLGIKAGMSIYPVHSPVAYADLLEGLPDGVRVLKKEPSSSVEKIDFIHFFAKSRSELKKTFPRLKKILAVNGTLWISWPKSTAPVPIATDLNSDTVRAIGLKTGLVDVKVCAVDETWSGLKFVFRLTDRK